MSFNYWDMKLTGGYVYHEGKVKIVEQLSFDDDKWENDGLEGRFPEDFLPYLTFHLSGGIQAEFGEFEIKFPDDQWYLTSGKKASCLSRKMSRQYKIAPTAELYDMTINDHLSVVLPLCDNMKYNKPEELWDWTTDDKVFNKSISLVRHGHTKRHLMYNETIIGVMTRGKLWVKLTPIADHMPKQIVEWWGAKFNTNVKAPADNTTPEGADTSHCNYRWVKVENGRFRPEGRQYQTYRDAEIPNISFSIGSTNSFCISRSEDIELLRMDGRFGNRERIDIHYIFNHELGDLL